VGEKEGKKVEAWVMAGPSGQKWAGPSLHQFNVGWYAKIKRTLPHQSPCSQMLLPVLLMAHPLAQSNQPPGRTFLLLYVPHNPLT